MNWPLAVLIIVIVVISSIEKFSGPTPEEVAQTEIGKACVASGQEWVKSWGEYECRRAGR